MNLFEREMMDAMAAGSILDCYPEDVWELIYKRAAQTKPYEFPESMYYAHHEDAHEVAPELEQRMQELSDMLADREPRVTSNDLSKLIELITQDVSIELEKESTLEESASRPLAQTECTTNLVAQPEEPAQLDTHMQNDKTGETRASEERNTLISSDDCSDMVLKVEDIEEICKDEASMSPFTPIFMDDKSTDDAIYEEEEEEVVTSEVSQVVPITRNKDTIPEREELISSQRTDTTTE